MFDSIVRDIYPVLASAKAITRTDQQTYQTLHAQSLEDAETFWTNELDRLNWIRRPTKINGTQLKSPVSIKWFEDGVLNVSVNCLDRHIETRGDQTAILYEGDEPGTGEAISYKELLKRVCIFANILKRQGVKKGDRVVLYLPMTPQATVAMLACARIGAVHSVIFGGFSPEAIASRVEDCGARVIVTADEGLRGGRTIPLKQNVDMAVELCLGRGLEIDRVIVTRHTGADINFDHARDCIWQDMEADVSDICEPEPMDAEDPLFILYTSGSTGKPKGVLHTTAGYLMWVTTTFDRIFDYQDGEVFWCTADVGWITGHSYIVYGPLANGAISLVFESVPTYPDAGRLWDVVDRHQVNVLYTAPTALRALRQQGDDFVTRYSRKSLRLLGSVGEPINPDAWEWYYRVVGDSRCPIIDTWWQTETGGCMMTPLPGATDMKPGAASMPFFGVNPALIDADGNFVEGAGEGHLVILDSWPGQARTVFGDHKRFEETYFSTYPGMYFTGDGCRRDEDGYYWITGRVDDVINVSGHRLGTAEIENALVSHPSVTEAAVVGFPHDIKGQGIYAYVTLDKDFDWSDDHAKALVKHVRSEIGPIATPDFLQHAPDLPKTRSGKIMRRILRKIAENEPDQLGDITTLADPSVVARLVDARLNQ